MRVRAAEVAVADFSRKGRVANAAVVGLGRTRRILVSDTLVRGFPPEEVEVVLAHELGHHARRHMAQGLVFQSVLIVVDALGGRPGAPRGGPRCWACRGRPIPPGCRSSLLVLTALGFLATPIAAAWSRRLEREADRVALEVTRAPDAFVAAMERLGQLNLAERRPGRLRELLFATHPVARGADRSRARGPGGARRSATERPRRLDRLAAAVGASVSQPTAVDTAPRVVR